MNNLESIKKNLSRPLTPTREMIERMKGIKGAHEILVFLMAALRGEKGERGESIVGPQGEKGEKGDRGEKGEKGDTGERGKDGKDGKDGVDGLPGMNGEKGDTGTPGKDGSPDTPEQIAEKLNTLEGKVNASVIKDLPETIASIWRTVREKATPKGGGGSALNYADLSSQCDGNTRTFTFARSSKVLGVFSTTFPQGAFRPQIDWTASVSGGTTTLILEASLPAPEAGQTLWVLYAY